MFTHLKVKVGILRAALFSVQNLRQTIYHIFVIKPQSYQFNINSTDQNLLTQLHCILIAGQQHIFKTSYFTYNIRLIADRNIFSPPKEHGICTFSLSHTRKYVNESICVSALL